MVAIKSHEADRFLARDVAGFSAYLVHGSDGGLVSERVRALTRALVDDPADPFQLVRLGGDEVASDPGRLADEAMTVPLFGGRRAILVDVGAKNIVPALEHHLTAKDPAPVVIEAGSLRKDAPLRKACERAKNAVALECYLDEERDLARLIDAETSAAGAAVEERRGREGSTPTPTPLSSGPRTFTQMFSRTTSSERAEKDGSRKPNKLQKKRTASNHPSARKGAAPPHDGKPGDSAARRDRRGAPNPPGNQASPRRTSWRARNRKSAGPGWTSIRSWPSHFAPSPSSTTGTVLARILMSSHNDQLSM